MFLEFLTCNNYSFFFLLDRSPSIEEGKALIFEFPFRGKILPNFSICFKMCCPLGLGGVPCVHIL